MKLFYYYIQIYATLVGSAAQKRKILKMIKENIRAFKHENHGSKFRDVKQYFGEPDSIAAFYQPELENLTKAVLNTRRIAKIILWTLCSLAVLVLIFYFVLCLLLQLTIPTYLK